MHLTIKSLRLIGYWSQPDRSFRPAQAIGMIGVVLVWFVVPELMFIVRQGINFLTFVRNLAEILVIGIAVPQALNALMYRPLLEETYAETQSSLDTVSADAHRDIQRVIKGLKKFSEWIFKGYIGVEVAVAGLYFSSIPVAIILKYWITGVLPPLQGVFEADYLFFDYQANVWLWFTTIVMNLTSMSYVVLFLISCHCISWSLLHNVSGLLKIISMKIGRLDEFTGDAERHKELTEIIELHEVAYRGARALEKSLNVFMLILYGMCILNLCLTMVSLSLPNSDLDLVLKMIVILVYILFNIFVYSMLGTELMYASTAVSEALYGTHWYMRSVSEQRIILFALTRSQKMVTLSTGKYFPVSRTTFGMALRTAMSYFAVLRQVYASQ